MRARGLGMAFAMLCAVGGLLVFGGASALALNKHLFGSSFGGEGAGNGQFVEPSGVAVNAATHDVYVVDHGNSRVQQFSSAGAYIGQFDGSAAPSGVFSAPSAIAVDNSENPLDPSAGDVYVVDTGHNVIDKFTAGGTYVGQLTQSTSAFGEIDGVAVDPNGQVWVYQASGEIDSFGDALANEFLSLRSSPFGVTPGFAVDSQDDLYVNRGAAVFGKINSLGEVLSEEVDSETSNAAAVDAANDDVFIDNLRTIGVFTASGAFIERFGVEQGIEHLTHGSGVAVDPASGTVYVADSTTNVVAVFTSIVVANVQTGSASGVGPTSATVSGVVNPAGVQLSACRFEYGTDTSYGQSAPCVPAAGSIPGDSSEHQVTAELTGLQAGTAYHYRLLAANANGANAAQDASFQTPPPPSIDGAAARDLTGSAATLTASIDPRGLDTTYRFEYGPSTAYGTNVPDADIGAGESDVAVSRHVGGLQANVTYHWRVVARNANGTTTGEDHTFIYSTGLPGLPDNRAYEKVTPSLKGGASVSGNSLGINDDVAADGSRVVIPMVQCFGDVVSCPANNGSVGTPYAFSRGSGGWSARALAPPASQWHTNSGLAVSADSGMALFTMPTAPAGESDWYARGVDGSFSDIGPTRPPSLGTGSGSGQRQEATADLSHLVYQSAPVWPFDATARVYVAETVYEDVGTGNAAPLLVGVSGGRGSTDLVSECGTELGNGAKYAPGNALSADGRVVLFTAWPCASGTGVNAGVEVPSYELFARIDESRTVMISGRSPLECTGGSGCQGSPPGDAELVSASSDGSKVFFLDTQRLTDSASEDSHSTAHTQCPHPAVGGSGCNLYEYDLDAPAGRNLVAVSAGDTSGGGPRVQGVVAVSPDGSHVYFVARGVLTGAANDRGQVAQDGGENLYVFERDAAHPGGQLAFIATLPEADNEITSVAQEWTGSNFIDDVTPDGRFLVFVSRAALTADDSSSTGAAQVFRYDAQTGQLVRISIGEGGFNDNGNAGVGVARIVPPLHRYRLGVARTSPTMSSDGSFVFFESPIALTSGALDDVPLGERDRNGEPAYVYNVYEYHEGHVYLLSDGRDLGRGTSDPCEEHESAVCLLGADASGRNVFFMTSDPLLPEDGDSAVDVYDARVCTQSEPCIAPATPAPAACLGDACHGAAPPAPPVVDAGTSVFSGLGNLAAPTTTQPKAKKKHKVRAKKKPTKRPGKKHKRRGKASRRRGHTSRTGGE